MLFIVQASVYKICLSFFQVEVDANFWYVSDNGSDLANCQTANTPCRNLQTVLNKAADGAVISVMSTSLNLDGVIISADHMRTSQCVLESSVSFSMQPFNNENVEVVCSGKTLF